MAKISFYSKEQHREKVLRLLQERLKDHQIVDWAQSDFNAEEFTYAICWHPPTKFFRNASGLKAIFSLAAGVDHLINHPELPEGVPLVRLTDAGMGDKIAEYVHYGVLRTHRCFDQYYRLQKAHQWQPLPDRHAADFRVGLLGFGVIGRSVGHRLQSAGYNVSAFRRSKADGDQSIPVLSGNITDFLQNLDVLVAVLPLTPQTTNMINADLLGKLPQGAHFINVGRGDQVVEKDLIEALNSGQLSTALLDVCATEPLPPESPLWSHEQITITPHVSGPTQITQSVDQIAESILKIEAGADATDLPGLVDNKRGY